MSYMGCNEVVYVCDDMTRDRLFVIFWSKRENTHEVYIYISATPHLRACMHLFVHTLTDY